MSGKFLRWVWAVFAVIFIGLIGSNLWIWSAGWGRLASEPSQVPAGSVMLVLGTDEFNGTTGGKNATYVHRIEAAVELARSGKIKFIVCSGTAVHASTMAEQIRAAGVTCPIIEDPYGLRTLDSVLRAKAYYPREHIVFVSQGWHCVRALWLADHESLSASAYPAKFGDGWRSVMSAGRDCFAKPKAVIDRYIFDNPLMAPVPANEGNLPHR